MEFEHHLENTLNCPSINNCIWYTRYKKIRGCWACFQNSLKAPITLNSPVGLWVLIVKTCCLSVCTAAHGVPHCAVSHPPIAPDCKHMGRVGNSSQREPAGFSALLCLDLLFSTFWGWPRMGNEGSRVPGLRGALRFLGHLGVSGTHPVTIAQSLHAPGAKALKIYFPVDLVTQWEDPNIEQCFSFTAESPAWLNTHVPHACPKPMCLNVTQGEVHPALLENRGCFFQVDSFALISGELDHLWGDRLWGNKNYVQQAAYWE